MIPRLHRFYQAPAAFAGPAVVPDPPTFDPNGQGGLFTINSTGLTASLTSGGWQTARTTQPQTTGKWYIEMVATAMPSTTLVFGACSYEYNPTILQNYVGFTAKSFGLRVSGTAFFSGVTKDYTSGFSVSQGNTIMLALDLDNGRLYMGVNGTWTNSGDPAAGTGYVAHWTPNGTDSWGFACSAQASGSVYTVTLSPTTFAYSAPSGFSALPSPNRSLVNRRVAVWAEGDSITIGAVANTVPYPILLPYSYQLAVGGDAASGGSTVATLSARAATTDAYKPGTFGAGVVRYALTVLIGYNDMNSGGLDAATFCTNLATYLDARRTAGWYVGIATILPGTAVGFNAKRNTANATIAGWVGTHCDFLIDFAADATMGPDAAASDTSLYGDGIHPTQLGQGYLKTVYAAALANI